MSSHATSFSSYGPVFTNQEICQLGEDVIFEKAERRIGRKVRDLESAIFCINYDLKNPLVLRGAARGGYTEPLRYMLDTLNIPQDLLDYSFQIACGHGHVSAADLLSVCGADPTANDCNSYRWAKTMGHDNVLAYLILYDGF